MLKVISKLEIVFGIILLGISVLFHLESFLCLTEQCGGLRGGIVTFYGLLIGVCLFTAGLCREKGANWYAVSHLPLIYALYLATTFT
jgi:hypothetical protein